MSVFRASARTLDMLGRQQIAGIPTAISELFKNAHDAYADRVEIDFFRSDRLFVLRDDGGGMTREEFERLWLTLGTGNKIRKRSTGRNLRRPDQERRRVLGEKGIGRLAIAAIGPQVLVMTRARLDSGPSDLVAAFINWTLFECPGVALDDIEIPIRTFPDGQLPSREDVVEMLGTFRKNAKRLRGRIAAEHHDRVLGELEGFAADPREIVSWLGSPHLREGGCGTHFVIQPASELLALDIDGDGARDQAAPLTKELLGFSNTMTPGHPPRVIRTAFRDHQSDDLVEDLLGENEFFTPAEFRIADHRVAGRFDEYGQFRGRVSIFGEERKDHVIPWPHAGGRLTACGPFSIAFAAAEGEERHSTLKGAERSRLFEKMTRIGGIYLYRDGVRILPYGNPDYDWLEIELNRSKHAAHYYFSHRKMFGAVEIAGRKNGRLREKAGREGFRKNLAYRQFRAILQNFLLQMAADFFRTGGAYTGTFEKRKAALGWEAAARRRREQRVSHLRKKLVRDLDVFRTWAISDEPREEAEALHRYVRARIRQACSQPDDASAAEAVYRTERDARRRLRAFAARFRVQRPRIGLSRALRREWEDHERMVAELEETILDPTRKAVDRIIEEETSRARLGVDRRRRAEASLAELRASTRKAVASRKTTASRKAGEVADSVRIRARQALQKVETEVREVVSGFETLEVATLSDEEFLAARDRAETRIEEVMREQIRALDAVIAQLESFDLDGAATMQDQLAAEEQRRIVLEEAADRDLQLAQLGMAVGIINHEFGATVRSIRINLRRLKAWADLNEGLVELSDGLRANFEHLDGYLTLFTPLQRRLYRKRTMIRGFEIGKFLKDLFRERLPRHRVSLLRTRSFRRARLHGFRSTFYPVFVNLVDNAIYWTASQNPTGERRITLDADDGVWTVTYTGPGVHPDDQEAIFEHGFTRKPGGRGMGLYIARETLRREGYDLRVAKRAPGTGARFVMEPIPKGETT